jgi:hypothetical protein
MPLITVPASEALKLNPSGFNKLLFKSSGHLENVQNDCIELNNIPYDSHFIMVPTRAINRSD